MPHVKHNFYAGPAVLLQQVLDEAAEAVKEFSGMGLSLLDISHRNKQFEAVMEESAALVKEVMGLGDEYDVLLLTGGASSQFFMVPMHLLKDGELAAYVNSGTWATGATKEAKLFGRVNVVASSGSRRFPVYSERLRSVFRGGLPSHYQQQHDLRVAIPLVARESGQRSLRYVFGHFLAAPNRTVDGLVGPGLPQPIE